MATASVTNTFVDGTVADADDVNLNFDDLVNFLNASVVHVDGSKAMTGDLDLGTNKVINDDGSSVITFTQSGELATGTGSVRFYLPFDVTIVEVEAAVGTAPTGSALIVDVNVDGTTIFTGGTNRPQIAASSNVGNTTTIDDASHSDGQYVTVDVDQVGSSTAGSDLVVTIRFRRA